MREDATDTRRGKLAYTKVAQNRRREQQGGTKEAGRERTKGQRDIVLSPHNTTPHKQHKTSPKWGAKHSQSQIVDQDLKDKQSEYPEIGIFGLGDWFLS